MAEKKTEKTEKKKKSSRAYLESFQKNQEGNYEYKGELYAWQGTGQDRRRELARLWGLCIALLGSLAGAGSVDAPGAINCAYVILPYVINLIAGISVCWGLCRLSAGGNPVRAYVWKASVEQIPGRAAFACICGGASLAGELIFVVRNGLEGKTGGFAVFLLLECLVCASSFGMYQRVKKLNWEKQA